MRLNLSDVTWQWLRLSDEYAPLFRVAEMRQVHAALFRPADLAFSSDHIGTLFTYLEQEFDTATSDYIGYAFRIGAKSSVSLSERLAFTWDYKFVDVFTSSDKQAVLMVAAPFEESHTPSDRVWSAVVSYPKSTSAAADSVFGLFSATALSASVAGSAQFFGFGASTKSTAAGTDRLVCTFQAGVRDAAVGADRVFATVVASVRDSVTASSSFLLGGRSFLDTASTGFSSDAFYSTLVAKAPESAATSDSVVIGIRYLIEFYFGGLAIGGSPFGGRL